MESFFGRRHSISGDSTTDGDGLLPRIARQRRASTPNIRGAQDVGLHGKIRDFFRRHRQTSPCAVTDTVDATSHPSPLVTSKSQANDTRSQHGQQHKGGRHSTSSDSIEKCPTKSREISSKYHLARSDVEVLFSGAPYFMLEKGKQDTWYPQVIFPFDDHDPSIQSLWDRRALPYGSYTLCTLHAHLPIPNHWMMDGEAPVHLDAWKRARGPIRASFDIGMFEVPNMLSMDGKEPGSIGFHYFLEMPVADSNRYTGPAKASACADFLRLSSLPASETYELMEHYNKPYALCADGTVHDRKTLLRDGPAAWKRIGVRDIDLKYLVERLQILKDLRYEILHGKKAKTILDLEGTRELFSGLFTKFLYPPPRFMLIDGEERWSIQCQIKALMVVLATPGAWFDFSLVEWRLRIGQLLWEAPPHAEGDFLDPSASDKPWVHPNLERKWFLVQMILAAELLLRLDATVRVGLLQNSHELDISARDIHDFDKIRTAKVNWDLVTVRRYMDCFNFSYNPIDLEPLHTTPSIQAGASTEKRTYHSFFESLTRRPSSPAKVHDESAWRCNHSPQKMDQQLQGLLIFAEDIGWPQFNELKMHFQSEIESVNDQKVKDTYNNPVRNAVSGRYGKKYAKSSMYTRSSSYRPLLLQCTQKSPTSANIGGWISRSWLSGFVLPGEGISHFLIATILENDADAMALLGPIANLYGGFSYKGRSWWSKECIVGRVLSSLSNTKTCMGWLGSSILPHDSRTKKELDNTWFEVPVKEALTWPGKPRIKQANRVSFESTPLGLGDLTSGAFSLPVDGPEDQDSDVQIKFERLVFTIKDNLEQEVDGEQHLVIAPQASTIFSVISGKKKLPRTISFPLTYNVQFIASHECRPPGRFISCSGPAIPADTGRTSGSPNMSVPKNHHRLPGHPLHQSYAYTVIPLDSLQELTGSSSSITAGAGHLTPHQIMVLDARGCSEKEMFARAWCASLGYHAILGRVGRTCLACCIREARAVKVRVVIRVGTTGPSRPLSKVNSNFEC